MSILSKIAWRNLMRQGRRSMLTAGAMSVGIIMCMSMTTFSDGMFVQMFDALIGQQLGHVQVHNPKFPKQRSLYETLEIDLNTLDDLPTSVGVAPRLYGFALLAGEEEASGAQLVGIDPTREVEVTTVHDNITEGRYLEGNQFGEIIVGQGLAETLKAKLGDEVVALTQSADGSMGNALFKIVGIYKSGSSALDRRGAYIRLSDMQELLYLEGQFHEIAMRAPNGESIPKLLQETKTLLKVPDPRPEESEAPLVRTWAEVDPTKAQLFESQNVGIGMLLFIVFAVAGLGVLNTMLMSVFERTKEFGVLGALGLSPGQIMRLVLWETVFLALMATVIGGTIGMGVSLYFVEYGIDLSGSLDGVDTMGLAFDPIIKGKLKVSRVFTIVGILFGISVMAAFWPALRASQLEPAVAIRED